jgi:lysozyme family protein
MALSNFAACDRKRRRYEGGMSTDRHDPGNWTGGKVGVGRLLGTKYGIAASSYPNVDIPNLTEEAAAAIFKRDYWDKVAGDLQPIGVDLCLYDAAVHSGAGRAREFQRAVLGKTETLFPALARISGARGDYAAQVKALCARRLSFLSHLAIWTRYQKGFTARVADVEVTGVKMVLAAGSAPTPVAKKTLETEATAAATRSKDSAKGAGTVAVAEGAKDGGTVNQVDVTHFDWSHWLGFGFATLALILLAIFLITKWHQHKVRAAAYAAAAQEV